MPAMTHIYCPKCKTFFGYGSGLCSHGACYNTSVGMFAYNFYPVSIKKQRIEKVSYFSLNVPSTALRNILDRSLKQSRNQDFLGVTYHIAYVNNRDSLRIQPHRIDYTLEESRRYQLQGVKSARLFILMHKTNQLVCCDGILNLYSRCIRKDNRGVSVFEATWVSEGRKLYTEYDLVHGWIAKTERGSVYYHSTESPEHAIEGALRKRTRQLTAGEREERLKKAQLKRLSDFIESIPADMMLSRKDSLMAGNCEIGTDMFIRKHGLEKHKTFNARDLFKLEPKNPLLLKAIVYKMRNI